MIDRVTRSEDETRALGRSLAARLLPQGVLLLTGDLGAGKTVLVQGIGQGLGLEAQSIQSPTFSLIVEHDHGDVRLVHADLYRLDPSQVESLGLEEILTGPGVKVVEWAERIPFPLPGALELSISRRSGNETERRIRQIAGRSETGPPADTG